MANEGPLAKGEEKPSPGIQRQKIPLYKWDRQKRRRIFNKRGRHDRIAKKRRHRIRTIQPNRGDGFVTTNEETDNDVKTDATERPIYKRDRQKGATNFNDSG